MVSYWGYDSVAINLNNDCTAYRWYKLHVNFILATCYYLQDLFFVSHVIFISIAVNFLILCSSLLLRKLHILCKRTNVGGQCSSGFCYVFSIFPIIKAACQPHNAQAIITQLSQNFVAIILHQLHIPISYKHSTHFHFHKSRFHKMVSS